MSNKLIMLLVIIMIVAIIAVVLFNFLGIIEMDTEMLMTVLIVIIAVEIAVMILAFILKRARRKKTYPVQPTQPVPSQQPISPRSDFPLPKEFESIPQEILEYKIPGTVKSFTTQENGNELIGIEVKKITPSMKFGHNVFIIKERTEQVPLEKEPIIRELPKSPQELENVIEKMLEKSKSKKTAKKPKKQKVKVKRSGKRKKK